VGSIRRRSALAIVVIALVGAACSYGTDYTSDAPPSTSDLDSDSGTTTHVDGSTSSSDDAGGGGGGGMTTDGGEGLMAMRESGAPSDAGSGMVPMTPFCKLDAGGTLLACDDFDESMTLANQWGIYYQGAGSIAIDSKDSKSMPNSVLASVPAHATNYLYQDIEVQTGLGSGKFQLEFDFYATTDLANSGADITTNYACPVQIFTDQAPYASICYGTTELAAYIVSFNASAAGAIQKTSLAPAPPLNAWHHMIVTFSFSATGSISVAMDGKTLGTSATYKTQAPASGKPAAYVYPELGLETDGKWGDTTARFDNVRLIQL
jgi:hypothetical protein